MIWTRGVNQCPILSVIRRISVVKAFRHNGEGQTLCVGCLASGKQPLQWDSFIIEVQYDDGDTVGCFCHECFMNVKKYLHIKDNDVN